MKTILNKILMSTTALAIFAGTVNAADYTMKISMADAERDPDERQFARTPLRNFETEVEELSEGRIDVEIYWGGQLGKIDNVLNMVRGGQVEAVIAPDGAVAPFYPDVQIFGVPYLFVNRQVAHEVIDGPVGQKLADGMAATAGIRPMPWLENGGFRHFSANVPLENVDSLQGLKMRTMNNPIHMEVVKSLGASPTPIPWGDLYTSLQTGVVDGQENSLSTFREPKFEEVQKHIILDGHVYSLLMLAVSEQWYQSLPDDLKEVVEISAQHFKETNRELSVENENEDRAYLEGQGVTIVDPSLEEKAKFQEKTQPVAIEAIQGTVSQEIIDETLIAVKAAQDKL